MEVHAISGVVHVFLTVFWTEVPLVGKTVSTSYSIVCHYSANNEVISWSFLRTKKAAKSVIPG